MPEIAALSWHIGDVVRKARETRGKTRKELAADAHLKQSTLGELERNVSNYTKETLASVAHELGVSIEFLFSQVPVAAGAHGRATAPLSSVLDPDERTVIDAYRRLTPALREDVRRIVRAFALSAEVDGSDSNQTSSAS